MMRKKRIVKKVANNATAFEVRLLSTTLNEKKIDGKCYLFQTEIKPSPANDEARRSES
jgi:hypothetical protein